MLPGIASVDPSTWLETLRWPLTAVYLGALALISLYGTHRYWLVFLYARTRDKQPQPAQRFEQMPRVTVQLPMYNEGAVAKRIIDAACQMDYPADRLQIQVVDDSTDGTLDIAQQCVRDWRNQGVDIDYCHRTDRTGYKAGALEAATATATGEFIAIFDADFVPPPAFLQQTVHFFTDPAVGMVQTRWDHLNRNDSLLTRGQAIFLDGHFVIEHTARNRSGAWMNFNGTAGIWRREAISTSGGWQHDTLTEDVDLSYRAQLHGWQFVFLPWVTCPAELPPEINAFKSQQHRWTKGSIQTAIKLLPRLLRAKGVPFSVKMEAFFHLTGPMVSVYITLFVLLLYPAMFINLQAFENNSWGAMLLGMSLFALGTCSASVFYLASQKAQKRSVLATALQIPILMGIGIGIALNNAIACLEALVGHQSEFVRTPKYNTVTDEQDETETVEAAPAERGSLIPIAIPSLKISVAVVEVLLGCYMLECLRHSLAAGPTLIATPFLALFTWGYFYVGFSSLHIHYKSRAARRALAAG